MKNAVIIFAKFPEAGEVKTRLAASIGSEKAAEFYRISSEEVFAQCLNLPDDYNLYLFFNDDRNYEKISKWVDKRFILEPQIGNGLGEKMKNSFMKCFTLGIEKSLIIGTDAPQITAEIIETAFNYLDDYDVVLGPSLDGGYYLLGMRTFYPFLFDGIKWSSDEVLPSTLNILSREKIRYNLLPLLRDVDTIDDLYALRITKHPSEKLNNWLKANLDH